MLPNLRRPASLIVCALLLAVFALAAKEFVPPRVGHAKTYPARDEHRNEGVTIAADPYDTADKASIFTIRFLEGGFLPINLVISNDNDQPVALTDLKVQLVTADRTKINPATSADIQRRFAHSSHNSQAPRPRLPLPLPPSAPKVAGRDAMKEFDQASFMAKAVEPHANQAGFMFFDVEGLSHPLAGAHLYVSGVKDSKGNELIYFDIPLDKYVTNQPPK